MLNTLIFYLIKLCFKSVVSLIDFQVWSETRQVDRRHLGLRRRAKWRRLRERRSSADVRRSDGVRQPAAACHRTKRQFRSLRRIWWTLKKLQEDKKKKITKNIFCNLRFTVLASRSILPKSRLRNDDFEEETFRIKMFLFPSLSDVHLEVQVWLAYRAAIKSFNFSSYVTRFSNCEKGPKNLIWI